MAQSLAFSHSPLIQRLNYNGVELNNSRDVETFTVRAIESKCGRTFTHNEFDLTVSFLIDVRASGVAAVDDVVSRLMQPAAGLTLIGQGVGPLNINIRGPKDVRWGPKPQVLSVENKGGGNTVRIRWSCKWATLTCGDAVFGGKFPMEFVWKADFDIDRSGLTKRTISGSLTVPATRISAERRQLPITADQMRDRVVPAVPERFQRITNRFESNEAKTTITFTVVDEELPSNIFPPGVITAEAGYTVTQDAGKPYNWNATLTGDYEIARGFTVANALNSFFAKLKDCKDQVVNIGAFAAVPFIGKPTVIPWQMVVADPAIYGKQTVRLQATFKIVKATLGKILGGSGLWRPVPGSDWKKWATSIAPHMGQRGVAGLVIDPGNDKIVDLCRPDQPLIQVDLRRDKPREVELRAGGGPPPKPLRGADLVNIIAEGHRHHVLDILLDQDLRVNDARFDQIFPIADPASSYLDYRCGWHIESDDGAVIGSTLPSAPLQKRYASTAGQNVSQNRIPTGQEAAFYPPAAAVVGAKGPASEGQTFVQQRRKPVVYVTIVGHAVRAHHRIAIPELLSVGGSPVVSCNRLDVGEGFEETQIAGDALGRPIYAAKWKLRYVVADPPKTPMPLIPNPLLRQA